MNINPSQVKLTAWDTQRFQVEDAGTVVPATNWRIEPLDRGSLADGIYTSPKWIFLSRNAMVVATATNSQGQNETVSAMVELSNVRTWVVILSIFLFLMATGVLYALFLAWPKTPLSSHSLAIGPSSVVLKKGESQVFVPSAPVRWSDTAPNGVFTATVDSGTAQVTAMQSEGGDGNAKAMITISDNSLTAMPPLPSLRSGESVKLVAQTTAKDPSWTGEICTSDGTCTAPTNINEERLVIAKVTTKTPALTASIPIRLVPSEPKSTSILIIAMLFGALGGLLHAINSLVAFVGSEKFVSRWALFYLARPFVGAIMALLVFLVFKGQLAADTMKTTDLFAVAAVAGLVGMFSDRAAEKLKEIFEVALGPKVDARANKLQAGTAAKPTITDIAPKSVTVGTNPPPPLVVKGTGFVDKCKGQISGKDRPTTFQSASQVTITLNATDVATAGTLIVTVVNPTGEATNAVNVPVA